MGLKRKRSSPAFSSPSISSDDSSTTQSSPLPFFYAQSKPIDTLYHKPTWSFPTYDEGSSHLNSRTRKRHRDGRPDEQEVYESTVQKLFNAQRQHPHASPVLSQQQSQPQSHPEQQAPQRSTLHSFWRINQPPTSIPQPMAMDLNQTTQPASATERIRCEDCDGALQHDEAMEINEEVLAQETSCWNCRRTVCDTCAVQGDVRVCLSCASAWGR